MKLTPESKDTIEKIRLISGTSYEQCKDFFESLITYITLNYMEGKETYIPFLGQMKIKYLNDQITSSGKVANLIINIESDYNLQRIIGQIIDGDETEIHNLFSNKVKNELEGIAYGG